jgi:hypothetical protein
MSDGALQDRLPEASGPTLEQKVAALKAILTRHGPQVLDEPQRFENLLLDTAFSPAERAVLGDAAKLRIPQRILAQPDTTISTAVLARCVDQLSESMALRSDASRAAVELWIRALGRELPSESPPAISVASTVGPQRQQAPQGVRRRLRWLPEIKTREQALAIVRTSFLIFLGVAAFSLLLAIWMDWSLLVVTVIFAIGGIALHRFNSRAVAVGVLVICGLVFVLGCIGILITIAGDQRPRPLQTELWIAISLATWAALRATAATFRLRHLDQ